MRPFLRSETQGITIHLVQVKQGDHRLFVTFKGADYSQLSKVSPQIIPNFQGDRMRLFPTFKGQIIPNCQRWVRRLFPTFKGTDYSQLSREQITPNSQRWIHILFPTFKGGCTDYVQLSKLGPQIIPNFIQGGTYYSQLLGEGVYRLERSQ